jgi:hypothetical protein
VHARGEERGAQQFRRLAVGPVHQASSFVIGLSFGAGRRAGPQVALDRGVRGA